MTLENVEIVTLAAIVTPVILYHGGSQSYHSTILLRCSMMSYSWMILDECWNALVKC